MALGLMDFLGSISSDGTVLDFSDAEVEKAYPPFPVNNGLAQHIDTVMLAQEMNKRPHLSKRMQYAFLYHSVNKKKRYGKWAKKIEPIEQVELDQIKELYTVSQEKAIEYYRLMSPDDLIKLRANTDKGGSSKMTKVGK